jgi:hypothetical protein
MTTEELIVEVRKCGAVPVLIDGKLRVAPPGKLPLALKDELRQRADEIKALLIGCPADTRLPPGRNRWPDAARPPMPLRRCGALVCPTRHVHSPSRHKHDCAFPRFDPCRSRWFWLSPHGAIKCVACETPADLALVEGWVLGRETGELADGFGIPGEILSLLRISGPPQ